MKKLPLYTLALAAVSFTALTSCDSMDDNRRPAPTTTTTTTEETTVNRTPMSQVPVSTTTETQTVRSY